MSFFSKSSSDANGATTDPASQPQKYEGRQVVENPDGAWSHEKSITIEVGGKHMNIPTMFGGKEVSPQAAVEILRKNNWVDPDTGKQIPTFSNHAEALKAAQDKEKRQQSIITPEAKSRKAAAAAKELQTKQGKQDNRPLLKKVFDMIGGKTD